MDRGLGTAGRRTEGAPPRFFTMESVDDLEPRSIEILSGEHPCPEESASAGGHLDRARFPVPLGFPRFRVRLELATPLGGIATGPGEGPGRLPRRGGWSR